MIIISVLFFRFFMILSPYVYPLSDFSGLTISIF